ncbi:MAG: hypothetical protein AVDCRST_MAG71-499, partial [uncultured Lysobacter sp.]
DRRAARGAGHECLAGPAAFPRSARRRAGPCVDRRRRGRSDRRGLPRGVAARAALSATHARRGAARGARSRARCTLRMRGTRRTGPAPAALPRRGRSEVHRTRLSRRCTLAGEPRPRSACTRPPCGARGAVRDRHALALAACRGRHVGRRL